MTSQSPSSEILSAFEGVIGPGGVVSDAAGMARYLGDWAGDYRGQAFAVLRPGSVAEVQSLMRLCGRFRLDVIPQGGNTGLVSGAIAGDRAGAVVLSLERMDSIRHIDAGNFTLQADAGCVLQAIKDASDELDCLFPLALGAQGSCQIGGNAATNAGGVNVLRYGMARDLILGLEVVLPDGELWDGFSGLRKNNTGYDLKQLFIGSEGTLGVITGVEVKLFPKPAQTETAYIGVSSFEAAIHFFSKARRACSDLLSAFEIIGAECMELARSINPAMTEPVSAPVHVLLELSAGPGIDLTGMLTAFLADAMEKGLVTDAVLAASGSHAKTFWAIREGLVEGQAKRGYHVRTDLSVRISEIPSLVERARRLIGEEHPGWVPLAYGHAGDGNIHFNVLPPRGLAAREARARGLEITAGLYDIAVALGGSISAEHGIGRSRSREFWTGLSPSHRRMVTALKAALDPSGMMNPGCLIPSTEISP